MVRLDEPYLYNTQPGYWDIGASKIGVHIEDPHGYAWTQIAEHLGAVNGKEKWLTFLYKNHDTDHIEGLTFSVTDVRAEKPAVFRGECTTFPLYITFSDHHQLDGSPTPAQ